MTILETVRGHLERVRQADFPALAEKTGVSEGAIRKIRYGKNRDPRISTVQSLLDYFDGLHKLPKASGKPKS